MMLDWLLEILGGPEAGSAPDQKHVAALASLAIAHRVQAAALAGWRQREASGSWPAPPPSLTASARDAKLHSLAAATWLTRLGRALTEADIGYLALKGPALSASLYGDPSRRSFRDIDILVAPDQFAATVEIAERLGWRPPPDWRRIRRLVGKFDLELIGATPLQPILEVHSQLFGSHMRSPPIGDIPTVPVKLAYSSVRMLAPAEQIAYVALHGAKHFWFRLIWLTDLAELLSRTKLPSAEILRSARVWQAEAALRAGILLCRTHLGREIPMPPASRPALDKRGRRIARWAGERIEAGPETPETLRWHVRERLVSDKLLHPLLRSAMDFARPAEVDVRALGAGRSAIVHFLARPAFWARRRLDLSADGRNE